MTLKEAIDIWEFVLVITVSGVIMFTIATLAASLVSWIEKKVRKQ